MVKLSSIDVSAATLGGLCAGLLFILGGLACGPALAMGGGSGAQSSAPNCPAGQYYSKRCKECAKRCRSGYVWACGRGCVQRGSMNLNDDELYVEAVSLIGSQHYTEGLELLRAIEVREVPKVLNYIGFSVRKLGDVDEGIRFYHRAIALDPDYTLAREYLGEGYLQKGDVVSAKLQLAEIKRRGGVDCNEYEVLAQAIADHGSGTARAPKTW